MSRSVPRIRGVVTVVQESRFRLVDDQGITRHLVLARDAAIEPQDLAPLPREQAQVSVRFRDSDNLLAGIVHDIEVESPGR